MFLDDNVITVIFQDKEVERKYRESIENFLKNLLSPSEKFSLCCSHHEVNESGDSSFCIDKNDVALEDIVQNTPIYDSTFNDTLESFEEEDDDSQEAEKNADNNDMQLGITCFNCLGKHHLKDCPLEHDKMKISENKLSYQETVASSCRYHENEEQIGNHRPGHISETLREALGLRYNQLPSFIYYMRLLGYPPGWLKEAEIENSGLNLYDSEGIANSSSCTELNSSVDPKRYDYQKFYEYPGFNTPIPDGMLDEWEDLNMIPMQPHQQLSEALKHQNVKIDDAYRKKKLKLKTDSEQEKSNDDAVSQDKPCDSSETLEAKDSRMQDSDSELKADSNAAVNCESHKSVSVSPGTSIIDTGNLYKRLPDCEKFAVGITEHLPYENLPDAVGTFEKMRGVISKVREKLECCPNEQQ